MKILINCSNLKKGGGLQVAQSFISEISNRADHEYHIVVSSTLTKLLNSDNRNQNVTYHTHDANPSIYSSLTGRERTLDSLIKKIEPGIAFTVFGPSYWKPKCLHVCGFAKPSYIYKESPFFEYVSKKYLIRLWFRRFFHLFDLEHFNQAIITETEDVTSRVKKLFPGKQVFTVTNTYNQVFDFESQWDKRITLPDFKGITLLTISANYPHKNLHVIPKVISYLKTTYPDFSFRFVISLNETDIYGINMVMKEHLLFLGRVKIQQCPFLYNQSDFMFLPTLLECFSASYPEAMKMGIPILTSDLSFAKGICGDAAEYFDPLSPQNIGDTIYHLSKNKTRRTELVKNGKERLSLFETAKSRADKYIHILENFYETNHPKL